MIWLYYFGLASLLAVAGPFLLLFTKKARVGLAEKFGAVPERILPKGARPRIWFHTVSVGEFNATLPLMQAFKQAHPQFEIFVSTTTGTGQKLARDKAAAWATVFYFPFDLPGPVQAWLDRVQPDVVAIAETEIWPGFVLACKKRNIQVVAINARISPRSFKQYERLTPWLSPVIAGYAAIAAQSRQEAQRYVALGAAPDAVHICGNMKFDGMKALEPLRRAQLSKSLNVKEQDVVLVGGSTHEGEEAALLQAAQAIPGCKLIIAPRHPERFSRVFQIVESFGCRVRAYSRGEAFERENDVYVLDTIGELMAFYSQATIAFVGGTLAPIGGHNLVEPCIYDVPVICGPHVEKTRDVARALVERQAIIKVEDGEQLKAAVVELAGNAARRKALGQAGKQFLDDSQGAVLRTLAVLEKVLPNSFAASQKAQASAAGLVSGKQ